MSFTCFAQEFEEIKLSNPRMNGNNVIEIQTILCNLGLLSKTEIDGWYGPITESAVCKFQNILNIKETGIIDSKLYNIIKYKNLNTVLSLQQKINKINLSKSIKKDVIYIKEYNPYSEEYEEIPQNRYYQNNYIVKDEYRETLDCTGYIYNIYYEQENSLPYFTESYWTAYTGKIENQYNKSFYFINESEVFVIMNTDEYVEYEIISNKDTITSLNNQINKIIEKMNN